MQKLIFLLAISAALALPAFARKGTGALEGTVVDQNGTPLERATVDISPTGYEGASHARQYRVRTDKQGHFFYGGLPVGRYSVNIGSRDGRVLKQNTDVRVEAGMVQNLDSASSGTPSPSATYTMSLGSAGGLIIDYRLISTPDSFSMFRNQASGTVTNTTSLPVTCKQIAPAIFDASDLIVFSIRLAPRASQTFSRNVLSDKNMSALGPLEWKGRSCTSPLSYEFADRTATRSFAGGVVKGLVRDKEIGVVVENNSDQPIEIDWNGSSFIDTDRSAKRIFHSGVKYADREQSLPNTTIPPLARSEDAVIPADHVRYSSDGWIEDSLFPAEVLPGDAEAAMRTLRGAKVSLFLQLLVSGKKTSVTLTSEVSAVTPGNLN
jgi:hypothetical protein